MFFCTFANVFMDFAILFLKKFIFTHTLSIKNNLFNPVIII